MRMVFGALALGLMALPATSTARDNLATQDSCYVVEVAAFSDRVHIRCNEVSGQHNVGPLGKLPFYFAVPTGDPLADKALTIASGAKVAGKTIKVVYLDSAASNPPGCAPSDCRRLVAVSWY